MIPKENELYHIVTWAQSNSHAVLQVRALRGSTMAAFGILLDFMLPEGYLISSAILLVDSGARGIALIIVGHRRMSWACKSDIG